MTNRSEITILLERSGNGDKSALDELLPYVYDELHRIAARQLRAERPNHTLQPTALVNEAYLVLVRQHSVDWRNRLHFFSIAAEAMRRILVNHAVARNAQKRRPAETLIALDEVSESVAASPVDLVELDAALRRLEEMDRDQAKIVEMKFFGGLTNEEIAAFMGISVSTVKREWASARAWLLTRICQPAS